MGRPAKPPEEKKVSGHPGKRKPKDKEKQESVVEAAPAASEPPTAQAAAPSVMDPPASIKTRSGVAEQKWREYLPLMIEIGLVARSDLECLSILCLAHDRAHRCQQVIDEKGFTEKIKSKHGSRSAVRKEVQILQAAEKTILNYMEALGLTSSSRLRLTALGIKSNQLMLPFDKTAPAPAAAPEKQDAPAAAAHGNDPNDPTGFVNRVYQ
jgi:P27 family predicted phage terminase small subunit